MTNAVIPAEKTLLLVDDDHPFLTRLARAMEARGFEVLMAESVAEGVAHVKRSARSRRCTRPAPRRAPWC